MRRCPCDETIHPVEPQIPAGLDDLPRQTTGFPEFRRALLQGLQGEPVGADRPLSAWRAREGDDLGLMLLEMWAYVGDVLAFYDERVSNESYLRPASQVSLRMLLGLLGLRPTPGVGGQVLLAATVDGDASIALAAGVQFGSEPFEDEASQVFETETSSKLRPDSNAFTLSIRRDPLARVGTTGDTGPSNLAADSGTGSDPVTGEPLDDTSVVLLEPSDSNLVKKDIVIIRRKDSTEEDDLHVARVVDVRTVDASDGAQYTQLTLQPAVEFGEGTSVSELEVLTPSQRARPTPFDPSEGQGVENAFINASDTTRVRLDAVYSQLSAEELVVVSRPTQTTLQVRRILQIATAFAKLEPEEGQPTEVPITEIHLEPVLSDGWENAVDELRFHFNFVDGGRLTTVAKSQLEASDLTGEEGVPLDGVSRPTAQGQNEFLLEGADGKGCMVDASLEFATNGKTRLKVSDDTEVPEPLRTPVRVLGNIIRATRGASVVEILGDGDATQKFQRFQLGRKPLTYLDGATSEDPLRSTLEIRVDGILWEEAPSFFGLGPEDRRFIVRHDEEQEAFITFGDGVNGSRLPTGSQIVEARYRVGSGAAAPPPGTVNQLLTPVKNLIRVRNPVQVQGGADPQSIEELRTTAPTEALLLGRAVSVQDFEAAARGVSGVINARAQYGWCTESQRAAVKVHYIGNQEPITILQRLRAIADPTTPIEVVQADPVLGAMFISLVVDASFRPDDVTQAVHDRLLLEDDSIFALKNTGIGQPLFRSQLFKQINDVPGVVSVTSAGAFINVAPGVLTFTECSGHSPGEGRYFDFNDDPETDAGVFVFANSIPDAKHRCGL